MSRIQKPHKISRKGRAQLRRNGKKTGKLKHRRHFDNPEAALAASLKVVNRPPGAFAKKPGLAVRAGRKGGRAWHVGPDGVKQQPKCQLNAFPPWEY